MEYRSLGDSLCPVPKDSLRLVVYINSECERCAAQTSEWAKREREFLQAGNVAILYYVRAADFPQVQALLERAGLSSPVFIDPESDLLYQNNIPESLTPLHTFLLDGKEGSFSTAIRWTILSSTDATGMPSAGSLPTGNSPACPGIHSARRNGFGFPFLIFEVPSTSG